MKTHKELQSVTEQGIREARYAYYRRCRHFRRNGQQCKAPAVKGQPICHKHAEQATTEDRRARQRRELLARPGLGFGDFKAVQRTISAVMQALLDGSMDTKTAGRLIIEIQTASKAAVSDQLTMGKHAEAKQHGKSAFIFVHAKLPGGAAGDEQKQKAVHPRHLTSILDGEEPAFGMGHEVTHRHLPAGEERGNAGKQSQQNQDATGKFDKARHQHQRRVKHLRTAKCAKQFLRAVAEKKKSGNDAQRSVSVGLKTAQGFHAWSPSLINRPLLSVNAELGSVETSRSESHHKILRLRMMDDDGRSGLFRFHVKSAGQVNADVLFRLEQVKDLGLVFQVGARRITERVTRAALFLMKHIANTGRVVAGNAQLFSHVFVEQLGQGLGSLTTQAV